MFINNFIKYLLLMLTLTFLLFGCQDNKSVRKLEKQIDSLKTQIDSLKTQYADLKQQVSNIQFDKLMTNIDKVAYLTPGSEGYSTIKFNLGVITISIKNIRPYANGSKVTFQFGNTLSSTITGLKGVIEYGPVDKNGFDIIGETKTKDISLIKPLRAGYWTNVDIVLDGIPPDKLGFVRFKNVTHTGIELLK